MELDGGKEATRPRAQADGKCCRLSTGTFEGSTLDTPTLTSGLSSLESGLVCPPPLPATSYGLSTHLPLLSSICLP